MPATGWRRRWPTCSRKGRYLTDDLRWTGRRSAPGDDAPGRRRDHRAVEGLISGGRARPTPRGRRSVRPPRRTSPRRAAHHAGDVSTKPVRTNMSDHGNVAAVLSARASARIASRKDVVERPVPVERSLSPKSPARTTGRRSSLAASRSRSAFSGSFSVDSSKESPVRTA